MSFPCTWCARLFKFPGGLSNHQNSCSSRILLGNSHVPSNLKILLPFRVVREINTVVTMRSESIQISERSTTAVGLTAAFQEASDSAKDVGIHQDSGESEADEGKSVESFL